jgi:GNAT superfamily N-acetyltransferase
MCAVYFSAFSDSLIGRECFPASSSAAQGFWETSLADEIGDPRNHFLVITDPSSSSPDLIIAFAKWTEPSENPAPYVPTDPDAWPKDGNPELANEFFGAMARKHDEIMLGRMHWYLELIATRKEHQGKGASSPLMMWGIEQAEKDGYVIYLESSPVAKPVYERFGFKVIDSLSFGDEQMTEYFMLRERTNE